MRVIKNGSREPKDRGKWWVGVQIECEFCHAIFRLDESDPTSIDQNGMLIEVACPTDACVYLTVFLDDYHPGKVYTRLSRSKPKKY